MTLPGCDCGCAADDVLVFRRGFPRTIKLRVPGRPDITGYTFILTVKTKATTLQENDADSFALLKKTITSITNPMDVAGGYTFATLTADDLDLKPGKYVFDVVVLDDLDRPVGASWLQPFIIHARGTADFN